MSESKAPTRDGSDRNADQAADAAGQASHPQAQAPEVDLNRRMIFGAGMFAGFAAVLASACSGSSFSSGSSNGANSARGKKVGAPDANDGGDLPPDASDGIGGPDSSDADGPDSADWRDDPDASAYIDANDGGSGEGGGGEGGGGEGSDSNDSGGLDSDVDTNGGNLDSGDDTDSCYANTAEKLDLSETPEATGADVPAVKFYGKDKSAMVALQFTNGGAVSQVVVCKEDGQLLALHGMTGADAGGTRPIIVDNIDLTGVANVKLLIQKGNDRVVATIPKQYFTSFNNATVSDLASAPNDGAQSVAQFAEGVGSFNKDANVSYPNDYNTGSVRNLQTAKTGSTWTPGAGVKGTVTDVMGNSISVSGSGLIENPTFCTYNGGFRTMIRIG